MTLTTAREKYFLRRSILQIIFQSVIEHEKTAAKELADLIPAIDCITAIYYWEYPTLVIQIADLYEKCQEIISLKLEFP